MDARAAMIAFAFVACGAPAPPRAGVAAAAAPAAPAPSGDPLVVAQALPRVSAPARLSPDGRLAVFAARTGVIVVDPARGEVRAVLPRCATDAVFLGGGSRVLALGCSRRVAFLWELSTGASSVLKLDQEAGALARSTAGDVAIACQRRSFSIVDARRRRVVPVTEFDQDSEPCEFGRVVVAPDGHAVAMIGRDVRIFDAASGALLAKATGDGHSRAIAWSAAGDAIAFGVGSEVVLLDAAAGGVRSRFPACGGAILTDVAFVAGGLAASCAGRGTDAARVETFALTGAPLRRVRVPVASPALETSPRGGRLLAYDNFRVVEIDVASGATLFEAATGCALNRQGGCVADDDVCAVHASRDLSRVLVHAAPLQGQQRHALFDVDRGATPSRTLVGAADPVTLVNVGGLVRVVLPRRSIMLDPLRDASLPDVSAARGDELVLEPDRSRPPAIVIVDRATGRRRNIPLLKHAWTTFSRGGSVLLAADMTESDAKLRTFDARTGKPGAVFPRSRVFDTNDAAGVLVAVLEEADCDAKRGMVGLHCVKTFDLRAGAELAQIGVRSIALPYPVLSRDGSVVVVAGEAFDARTGKKLWAAPQAGDAIFSRDGRSLWLADGERTAVLDPLTGRARAAPIDGALWWATFTPVEGAIVRDDEGLVLAPLDGTPLRRLAGTRDASWRDAVVAADASWVAWASSSAGVTLIRTSDGASLHRTLTTPALFYTDEGVFDGPAEALASLRVRYGPDAVKGALLPAVEGAAMVRRAGLAQQFFAGGSIRR